MTSRGGENPHRQPSRVGDLLADRYRIVRLIGEGGMGAVYEAEHAIIGHRVAVKMLHPHLACSEIMRARFQREARTAGRLRHENIVPVIDCGVAADGVPFLVMDLLDGEPLSQLLQREGMLPVYRAVALSLQACRALEAAHAMGVIHRDLKPDNIFVSRRLDGTDLARVLDFGIAKVRLPDGDAAITENGATIGTASYMAPEQARGSNEIDHRADVYALGAILYESLAGTKAHAGDSYNSVIFHILHEEIVPLDQHRPNLPPGLARVVHQALEREAPMRHPSVVAFAALLAPFVAAPRDGDGGDTDRQPTAPIVDSMVRHPGRQPIAQIDVGRRAGGKASHARARRAAFVGMAVAALGGAAVAIGLRGRPAAVVCAPAVVSDADFAPKVAAPAGAQAVGPTPSPLPPTGTVPLAPRVTAAPSTRARLSRPAPDADRSPGKKATPRLTKPMPEKEPPPSDDVSSRLDHTNPFR